MKTNITHDERQIGFMDKRNPLTRFYRNLMNGFEMKQEGYATLAIIVQNYIGSLAILMLIMNHIEVLPKILLLTLVFLCCLSFNVAAMRKFPPKVVLNLLIIGLVINISIMIFFLIWMGT